MSDERPAGREQQIAHLKDLAAEGRDLGTGTIQADVGRERWGRRHAERRRCACGREFVGGREWRRARCKQRDWRRRQTKGAR
jgi:hypothetical protein